MGARIEAPALLRRGCVLRWDQGPRVQMPMALRHAGASRPDAPPGQKQTFAGESSTVLVRGSCLCSVASAGTSSVRSLGDAARARTLAAQDGAGRAASSRLRQVT
jgi:hypothetical protein